MATRVKMVNPKTGIIKDGYFGFSYSFFFLGIFSLGWLVPLYRGNILLSLICFIFTYFTLPLWILTALLFGLFFNKYYTLNLIEDGYMFDDEIDLVKRAKTVLGVQL